MPSRRNGAGRKRADHARFTCRRVTLGTMRVAALGYDPGFPGIEAVAFGSAHPLGRYDALIWNPAGLVDEYRDLYTQPGKEDEGPLL